MAEDEVELTEQQVAYITECVGGFWQGTVLARIEGTTAAFTPAEGTSREEVVQQLQDRWPQITILPKEEWNRVFYGRFVRHGQGTGQRMAAGAGSRVAHIPPQGARGVDPGDELRRIARETAVPKVLQASDSPRPLPGEDLLKYDLDEWVPLVQCAKRLHYQPQYLYNAAYHGKLKTQGDRPKKALWRDVLQHYRPDVLKEVT